MWLFLTLLLLGAMIGLHLWWRKRLAELKEASQREVSELKNNQSRALSQFAAEQQVLFNSMVEGVLLLDKDGFIRIANRAFRDMFGLTEGIQGKTILETLRLHEIDEVVNQVRESGQVVGVEINPPGLDERVLQVNASSVIDALGELQGNILVFHDLTRLKRLERTRQEFVANVSHELRTPLALIKGYVETLIDGASKDPDLTSKFLGTIDKHADRLTFLIEDLLTISQLESGQIVLNKQPVYLGELATRVAEELGASARAKQVSLSCAVDSAFVVQADPQRLEQVLSNLVNNAIKYGGKKNGKIVIHAESAAEGGAIISVKDDGPGIPAAARERIFERFYRVDKARSREQGGTGLGLSIVKHIVQSHRGKVWVESEVGKGSAFYFTLPED
ncbi:MAG: sensor histidine kinase [Limisphaerales bacterium]